MFIFLKCTYIQEFKNVKTKKSCADPKEKNDVRQLAPSAVNDLFAKQISCLFFWQNLQNGSITRIHKDRIHKDNKDIN